eukprot:TRINITY_DN11135_c0_g1_i3.p1 TRINITY_DN11135_c0_g1~~TRINITY_DN11135_c0_g1_i3.p1  ORF type:complete len:332 (-),score=81.35 TRINITY_DN11135_c0_g1_i3:270-1265(-)
MEAPSNLSQVLGAFLPGRIGITALGLGMTKAAVAITVRHCWIRKQFSSKNSNGVEVPIIQHPLVQRKISTSLARIFTTSYAIRHCGTLLGLSSGVDKKFLHAIASGLKSVATWDFRNIGILCRELLGGQGFISRNRVGPLVAHMDLLTTGEGDNTMLMKQMIQAMLGSSWDGYVKLFTQSQHGKSFKDARLLLEKFKVLSGALLVDLRKLSKSTDIDSFLDFGIEVGTLYVRIFVLDASLAYLESLVNSSSAELLEVLDNLLFVDSWQICHEFRFHLLSKGKITFEELNQGVKQFNGTCEKLAHKSQALISSFGIPAKSLPESNLTRTAKL